MWGVGCCHGIRGKMQTTCQSLFGRGTNSCCLWDERFPSATAQCHVMAVNCDRIPGAAVFTLKLEMLVVGNGSSGVCHNFRKVLASCASLCLVWGALANSATKPQKDWFAGVSSFNTFFLFILFLRALPCFTVHFVFSFTVFYYGIFHSLCGSSCVVSCCCFVLFDGCSFLFFTPSFHSLFSLFLSTFLLVLSKTVSLLFLPSHFTPSLPHVQTQHKT